MFVLFSLFSSFTSARLNYTHELFFYFSCSFFYFHSLLTRGSGDTRVSVSSFVVLSFLSFVRFAPFVIGLF